MNCISKYFFRHLPNEATKRTILLLQKEIVSKINLIELELGIVIKMFVVGSISSSFVELISIQSVDELIETQYRDIITKIEILEKKQFDSLGSIAISSLEIEDIGLKRKVKDNTDKTFIILNNQFENWNDYKFNPKKEILLGKVELNGEPRNTNVSFIGNYFNIGSLNSYEELVKLKLYEQLWECNRTLINIREKGYCYSTVAKFHERLSIFIIGSLAGYSIEKSEFIRKSIQNSKFSNGSLRNAKQRLKKNLLISSSLNQSCYTLFPFWVFNKEIVLEDIINVIDKLNVDDLQCKFLSSEFVCTKIGVNNE
ncbi:hypothetical protein DSM12_10585 [Enterococcus faecium]|nr:hypothetical protein [Enterococcus faecium]